MEFLFRGFKKYIIINYLSFLTEDYRQSVWACWESCAERDTWLSLRSRESMCWVQTSVQIRLKEKGSNKSLISPPGNPSLNFRLRMSGGRSTAPWLRWKEDVKRVVGVGQPRMSWRSYARSFGSGRQELSRKFLQVQTTGRPDYESSRVRE